MLLLLVGRLLDEKVGGIPSDIYQIVAAFVWMGLAPDSRIG